MALYGWGSTINGELGLGGIEDEHILTPREVDWSLAPNVNYISCGTAHSLMITSGGKVYACGSNDFGQLGHEQSRKRPRMSKFYLVRGLENHNVTKVCCGASHSVAVTEWGNVYTWGSNSFGQLGHDEDEGSIPTPKLVRSLGTKQIVQVAVGSNINVVLTNEGEIYAWGLNNNGQVGIGSDVKKILTPMKVASLNGVPIAFIACGGSHTFAISKSGAVFGWGKNIFGQLGIGNCEDRTYPVQLKTLRSIGVRHVSAGEDFSVFLTQEGGVLTCGAGAYGQLGHGNRNNDLLPRMIFEMMGTTCTQVACGSRHCLTFNPSRGRIYSFGLGASGQLGIRTTNNGLVPQIVAGPWANGSTSLNETNKTDNARILFIKRIFGGGDHSFAKTALNKPDDLDDFRIYAPNTQIEFMTIGLIETCANYGKDDGLDLSVMSSIEVIFKNLSCFNASFLVSNDEHFCCSIRNHGIDMSSATSAFEHIQKIENTTLITIIWDGIADQILPTLTPSPPDIEALRVYLLLPLYHEFINARNYQRLHTPFARSVLNLDKIPKSVVSHWYGIQTTEFFEKLIENYKNVVMYILNYKLPKVHFQDDEQQTPFVISAYEVNLDTALKMLKLLYNVNQTNREQSVSYETFHIPELTELVYLQKDYCEWAQSPNQSEHFFFCNYPFLFNAPAKKLMLQTDQVMQMHKAIFQAQQASLYRFFFRVPTDEFIVFNISRRNIVQDTINEIVKYDVNELKKPLKIRFRGEEGEDAGGVQKEFFMLLCQQLFSTDYGMFKSNEESRLIWFTDCSFESQDMYKLVGTLCGLAIYNFTIINLPFPLALYKKLLKEDVDLSDLLELSPTTANSMKSILDYDGDDMEEVFELTFEISREIYDQVVTVQLKPGGDKIKVNQQNKKEFVNLYINYVFNESVKLQFQGFYDGFMKVCGGPVLELFRSHELRSLVNGNENYDWEVFENVAKYKNGYTSSDPTIRLFWEVFHELPLEEKKKFLLFLTGSDRVPLDGMKEMRIVFQPVADDKLLPVAHTCFNLLDLPRYQTKEKLKFKLLQAIQYNQRFSLV